MSARIAPRSSSSLDAVIFDLDATLVDSVGVARRAFSRSFDALCGGNDAPVDEFVALSGTPLARVGEILGLPDEFPALYREFAEEFHGDLALFPGVMDLLLALDNLEVPMAIITGKDRPRTLSTLELLGISRFFGHVVTPDDPPAPKPSPDGVRYLCELLGSVPDRTAVCGDSIFDMRAGRLAGATTVACLWGVSSEQELIAERPRYIVTSVVHLEEHLLSQL